MFSKLQCYYNGNCWARQWRRKNNIFKYSFLHRLRPASCLTSSHAPADTWVSIFKKVGSQTLNGLFFFNTSHHFSSFIPLFIVLIGFVILHPFIATIMMDRLYALLYVYILLIHLFCHTFLLHPCLDWIEWWTAFDWMFYTFISLT